MVFFFLNHIVQMFHDLQHSDIIMAPCYHLGILTKGTVISLQGLWDLKEYFKLFMGSLSQCSTYRA